MQSEKIKISEVEKKIISELIRNPRTSDNKISISTKIPLKTVNRKRKELEKKGILHYYSYLDNFHGTNLFTSRQMYIVTFKHGITRDFFLKKFSDIFEIIDINPVISKHVLESHLGEKNGCLVLVLILESFSKDDLIEIFNAEIVKLIDKTLGKDVLLNTEVLDLTMHFSQLHNYSVFSGKGKKINEVSGNIFISE